MFVKLKKLVIDKMYGTYFYEVHFNDDITFIYGLNGCGKTTVLNITEAIITGNLFYLFEYDFTSINLVYSGESIERNIMINKLENSLEVIFEDDKYIIEEISKARFEESYHTSIESKRATAYFENNKILSLIKETFNYVYLPLNRSSKNLLRNEEYGMIGSRTYYGRRYNSVPDFKRDRAISNVEILIMDSIRKMNREITTINNDFRNEILKSSLDISEYDVDEFNSHISEYNSKKIRKISKLYKREN